MRLDALKILILVSLAALAAGAGCSGTSSSKLVVIALDGADWNTVRRGVAEGRLPAMAMFFESGATGRLESLAPNSAEMNWASLWTGLFPEEHGVYDEELDAFLSDPGTAPPPALTNALWNHFKTREKRVLNIGLPVVDSKSGTPFSGSLHFDEAYYTRTGLSSPPVKLPETELFEHLQIKDFPSDPARSLSAQAMASARAVTNQAIEEMGTGGWDCAFIMLSGLDTLEHLFAPYLSPRLPEIPVEDSARYRRGFDAAYDFYDAQMGRLLESLPADSTVFVVSAHGFHYGPDRPYATARRFMAGHTTREHSPDGLLLAKGPGIRPGPHFGAWVLDVAPTVAWAGGEPLTEAAGHVLSGLFTKTTPGPIPSVPIETPPPPQGAARQLAQALYLWKNGKVEPAAALLQSLAKNFPAEPAPPFFLGKIAYSQGRFEAAAEHYFASTEAYADFVPATAGAAMSHHQNGEFDKAQRLLAETAATFPEPLIYNALGDILFDRNFYQMASQYYKQSIRTFAGQSHPFVRYAWCRQLNGYSYDAVETLRSDHSISKRLFTYLILGDFYEDEGLLDNMAQAAKDAIALAPSDPRGYLLQARAALALERPQDAWTAVEEASRRAPRDSAPVLLGARVQFALGQKKEALEALRRATEIMPTHLEAWLELGRALEASERPEDAHAVYTHVLEFSPFSKFTLKRLDTLESLQ